MRSYRFLRYLAPNLVTLASLTFGMLSLASSIDGQFADAAWFIIFSVLTDKLDGFIARLVKGTSEFGVQLDSFADFLNFGIAPAVLWYTFFSRAPGLGFQSGGALVFLCLASVFWVLAVTFRLARYNIVGDDPNCRRVFFGLPTTLMGGTLIAFFLACLKYSGAEVESFANSSFDEPRLLGDLHFGTAVWSIWPGLITLGAALMASTFKVPKLGLSKSKALTVFIFANVFAGYALGFARHLPEYLCGISLMWIVTSLAWGQVSSVAKSLRAPPLFPRRDLPVSQMPQRPEEDVLVDQDDPADEDDDELPAGHPGR
jgi:CDP-diacylglycerol--serine O-phosphatidyltransferase